MIADFPPQVQATVRRILDEEARRLLVDDGTVPLLSNDDEPAGNRLEVEISAGVATDDPQP